MSHASGIVASPELVSEFAKAKDDASVRFIQVAVEGTVLVSKRVGPKEADTAAGKEYYPPVSWGNFFPVLFVDQVLTSYSLRCV